MENFFLIYINFVGKDYTNNFIYEFIFSDTIKNVDGENWDQSPASNRAKPPLPKFIKKVGRLESKLILDVIQNSNSFSVWDAVDGVIALAWENTNGYDKYPEKRLSFTFGDSIEDVSEKLYEKDLILEYKTKENEKQK